MKRIFFTGLGIFFSLFYSYCTLQAQQQLYTIPTPSTDRRKINCEDLEYRLHLTRTDIEMISRIRLQSGYKDAFLRELQDHEIALQEQIRVLSCFE